MKNVFGSKSFSLDFLFNLPTALTFCRRRRRRSKSVGQTLAKQRRPRDFVFTSNSGIYTSDIDVRFRRAIYHSLKLILKTHLTEERDLMVCSRFAEIRQKLAIFTVL